MRGVTLTFDGLGLRGVSRAGKESWFRVDPPGLALDVGRGAEALVGTPWIFLSHGHLDHVLGLPWVLAQRKLQGLPQATVFCPRSTVEDIESFLRAASRLDGVELDADVVGLEPGERRQLAAGLALEVFAVPHPKPTLGCHLIRRQHKLRAEFSGATPGQIAQLKRGGAEITLEREAVWLTYCGDTGPAIFSSETLLFEAKILLIECTFMGPETRQLGARFGHLHLADFVEHADRFVNDAIVLTHLSRRFRLAELERAVATELPGLAHKVHFMVENGSPSV